MINDNEIDEALLAHVTMQWRKMAFVIAKAMMQTETRLGTGQDDAYFASRVVALVEAGRVEAVGDLSQMRHCEVRTPQGTNPSSS